MFKEPFSLSNFIYISKIYIYQKVEYLFYIWHDIYMKVKRDVKAKCRMKILYCESEIIHCVSILYRLIGNSTIANCLTGL